MARASIVGLFTTILCVQAAQACQCQTSYAPCNETAISNVVFIGTVESISPIFLSRWNLSSRASLKSLNDAYIDAQDHPSPAALSRLKATYLGSFPDLAPEDKERLQAAKTIIDVASVFYSTLNGGMTVRFKVGTLFKHEEDDDDDVPNKPQAAKPATKTKDDDDDDKKNVKQAVKKAEANPDDDYFDISTPFGDCGVEFQAGETYLVYADNDENSGLLSTTACTRTRRLSDVTDDLPYLFFYKEHREQSTRLEGFTTTDDQYRLGLNKMHDPDTMKLPVPGVIVELHSERLTRYATSDSKGRFVFDGLGEGDYTVSAFDREYPAKQTLLAGPQRFSLEPKSCALQVLVLPKDRAK